MGSGAPFRAMYSAELPAGGLRTELAGAPRDNCEPSETKVVYPQIRGMPLETKVVSRGQQLSLCAGFLQPPQSYLPKV